MKEFIANEVLLDFKKHLINNSNMKTYNLKNYTIVLDKIVFISGVFLDDEDSVQFNVKLIDDKLSFKFTNRADAVLQRELLVKAINEA